MRKGGRCSAVAALGANLLHLKPCIEVRNGKMAVCKKYRGSFEKCIRQYVKERLDGREDIAPELAFITHAAADANVVAAAKEEAAQYGSFETVEETQAGCTVSCHCGPNTLGILFVRKSRRNHRMARHTVVLFQRFALFRQKMTASAVQTAMAAA